MNENYMEMMEKNHPLVLDWKGPILLLLSKVRVRAKEGHNK